MATYPVPAVPNYSDYNAANPVRAAELNWLDQTARQMVSVKWFGVTGDGVTDDTAALVLAIAYENANKVGLFFPSGSYRTSATLAFILAPFTTGLSFVAGENVTIYMQSGAGPVVTLDNGPAGAYSHNVTFRGFTLRGNAAATYGIFMRGLGQDSQVWADVYDVATAAFYLGFSVLADYRWSCSSNLHTFAVNPTKGAILDRSGVGNEVADCSIWVNFGPGITDIGLHAMYTSIGTRVSGTCEGIPRGLFQDSTCAELDIQQMDFEANTDYDIRIAGRGLTAYGVNASSAGATGTVVVEATANSYAFFKGFARWVALNPASRGGLFVGLAVSDNAAIGITGVAASSTPGAGTHSKYRVPRVDATRNITSFYPDLQDYLTTWSLTNALRQSTAQTPTAAANSNVVRFANQQVHFRGSLTSTAVGVGANAILVDIAASLAIPAGQVGQAVGTFIASIAGTQYAGVVIAQATTTLSFATSAGTSLLGINPAATLAIGSTLFFSACWDFGG